MLNLHFIFLPFFFPSIFYIFLFFLFLVLPFKLSKVQMKPKGLMKLSLQNTTFNAKFHHKIQEKKSSNKYSVQKFQIWQIPINIP